ncbi:thiopeptide-type bacteriocin biosynthesis domain-containing protein [bacterium A37T11]|nr:thiopeptide-type bacteriocin biosynthesis domain-containing protein [bacterium A37T11]
MEAFDFYLLRVPRLPLQVMEQLNRVPPGSAFERALYELFREPSLQDAIYHASTTVFMQLQDWFNGKTTGLSMHMQQTLYKYVLRMAARATPFGQFAGVSTGKTGKAASALRLSGDFSPHGRADMELSVFLATQLVQDNSISGLLSYRLNTTLLVCHDHYRYYITQHITGRSRYEWVRMAKNPLLVRVLESMGNSISHPSLMTVLLQMGLNDSQAVSFLKNLLLHQLLVSSLEATLTGDDHLNRMMALHPHIQSLANVVQHDLPVPGGAFEAHKKITRLLDNPPVAHYFQVDLQANTLANQLNDGVINTLVKEVKELLPLHKPAFSADLQSFINRFTQRFGDQEVPLLTTLDMDRGIGYGEKQSYYTDHFPLIKNLGIGKARRNERKGHIEMEGLLQQYLKDGYHKREGIELTTALITTLGNTVNPDQLPPSYYLMGNLLATDAASMDRGNFKFHLSACSGSSAVPLMARFAYLDPQLEASLKGCAAYDAACFPDAILAEIIHLPDARMGNILQRPPLRTFEIPVLGNPSATPQFQIPLQDLQVSVRHNRVVLRSAMWNKQVIPRLASAHNYRNGMPVYRFLCDVQVQDHYLHIGWDWGTVDGLPFLPRVSYRHLILTRARWLVPAGFTQLNSEKSPENVIHLLREQYGLPEVVVLADGDNELCLNLSQGMAAHILYDRLKKGAVYLYEFLFEKGNSPVMDVSARSYVNEVIIPVKVKKPEQASSKQRVYIAPSAGIVRSFPPGSEWLYVKIYTGAYEGDRFLTDYIAPLVQQLRDRQLIDTWFFIRYHDPEAHIRLRLHVANRKSGRVPGQLISFLYEGFKKALETGIIHKLQLDTYDRELERYYPACMEACEIIFEIDSDWVLAVLPEVGGVTGEEQRWLAAFGAVGQLLDAFLPSLPSIVSRLVNWRDAFITEFKGTKKLQVQLDKRYRDWQRLFENRLSPPLVRGLTLQKPVNDILKQLSSLPPATQQSVLDSLLSGLCHMTVNRLFFANQRENELVIYHLLAKYYLSHINRRRTSFLK